MATTPIPESLTGHLSVSAGRTGGRRWDPCGARSSALVAVPAVWREPATGTESPDHPIVLEYTANVRMVRAVPGAAASEARHSSAESSLGASPKDWIRAGVMLSKIPRERCPARAFRLHSP